jgi:hypothetical protein
LGGSFSIHDAPYSDNPNSVPYLANDWLLPHQT